LISLLRRTMISAGVLPGRADTVPGAGLIARDKIGCDRDIRQHLARVAVVTAKARILPARMC
jgi:hypothetical protein